MSIKSVCYLYVQYIIANIDLRKVDSYLKLGMCTFYIFYHMKRYWYWQNDTNTIRYNTKHIKKFCKTIYYNFKSIPLTKSLFMSQYISL